MPASVCQNTHNALVTELSYGEENEEEKVEAYLEDEIKAALCALTNSHSDPTSFAHNDDDEESEERFSCQQIGNRYNNSDELIANSPQSITSCHNDNNNDVIRVQDLLATSDVIVDSNDRNKADIEHGNENEEQSGHQDWNLGGFSDDEVSIELQFEEDSLDIALTSGEYEIPEIAITAEEYGTQQRHSHDPKQNLQAVVVYNTPSSKYVPSIQQISNDKIHIMTSSSSLIADRRPLAVERLLNHNGSIAPKTAAAGGIPMFYDEQSQNKNQLSKLEDKQQQQKMILVQYFPALNRQQKHSQIFTLQQHQLPPSFVHFPNRGVVTKTIAANLPVAKEKITEDEKNLFNLSADNSVMFSDANNNKPHKCKECGVRFQWSSHLKRHEKTHSNEKFMCNICHAGFSQLSYFNAHRKSHFTDKPYKCEECGKRFVQSTHLKIHIMIHTGEKPFQCDVCKARFTQHGNLKRHVRTHTGEKPYLCDTCPARFTHSSDLTRHVRIHTGERPYKCHHCDTAFATNGNLKSHLRIHTSRKGHKCTVCKASFNLESYLRSHMRTHTGERPFVCACGEAFTQGLSFKFHLKAKMSPYCSLVT